MKKLLAALAFAALGSAATAAEISKEALKKALDANPDVLLDVLKENRKAVFDIVQQAAQEEQGRRQREEAERDKKEFEDSFKNPLVPTIGKGTRVRGKSDARFTLVEYSDFQCPYCKRGYQNVEALRQKYGESLRLVFKHMPLPFHPEAMPAARWMEAVGLQSAEKAWQFHDKLFESQDKLGSDFYKKTASELGLDMNKLAKDLESQDVKDKVEADIEEAKRFGFTGTPGYLLNGVPVRGAYPIEHFDQIIAKLEERESAPGPAAPKPAAKEKKPKSQSDGDKKKADNQL